MIIFLFEFYHLSSRCSHQLQHLQLYIIDISADRAHLNCNTFPNHEGEVLHSLLLLALYIVCLVFSRIRFVIM